MFPFPDLHKSVLLIPNPPFPLLLLLLARLSPWLLRRQHMHHLRWRSFLTARASPKSSSEPSLTGSARLRGLEVGRGVGPNLSRVQA